VQAVSISPGAVVVQLFFPFHQVCFAAVFLDESADAVAAFASALGVFDAEHVEFSFDVTEDDIGSRRYERFGDSLLCVVLTSTAGPCGFR
jgi:hypothetical protein